MRAVRVHEFGGLAIVERLAVADRGNADWQRNLAVAYGHIGNVCIMLGKIEEAQANFRKALAITELLASGDPMNIKWQVELTELNRALAINGDDSARRFAFIVTALLKLQTETMLTDRQNGCLSEAKAQVAKLTPK
jgi:hypothetical protein